MLSAATHPAQPRQHPPRHQNPPRRAAQTPPNPPTRPRAHPPNHAPTVVRQVDDAPHPPPRRPLRRHQLLDRQRVPRRLRQLPVLQNVFRQRRLHRQQMGGPDRRAHALVVAPLLELGEDRGDAADAVRDAVGLRLPGVGVRVDVDAAAALDRGRAGGRPRGGGGAVVVRLWGWRGGRIGRAGGDAGVGCCWCALVLWLVGEHPARCNNRSQHHWRRNPASARATPLLTIIAQPPTAHYWMDVLLLRY